MKITPNKKHRIIAYHDVHVPHEISFGSILDFQHDFDPAYIVLNGDFLNLESCSHWNETLFKQVGFGTLRSNLKNELGLGEDLIDRIRHASPHAKILYVPGNHESNLFWAAHHFPDLGIDTHVDIKKITCKSDLAAVSNSSLAEMLSEKLNLKKMGVQVLANYEPLQIGNMTFLHGHQITVSSVARLYPNKNVIFGHYHTQSCRTLNDNGDGEVVQHVGVPCMTKLGPFKPGYLRNSSTQWLNGFWIADVLANGLFDGRVKKVLGGKIMIP